MRSIKTTLAHFVTGFLSGFFIVEYPLFSIFLLILFILYEFSEWKITHDTLFPEIREYTIGYILGFMTYFAITILL